MRQPVCFNMSTFSAQRNTKDDCLTDGGSAVYLRGVYGLQHSCWPSSGMSQTLSHPFSLPAPVRLGL